MTVYTRTNQLRKKTSGAFGQAIYARIGGAWNLRPIAYKRQAGAWVPFYSTIDFGWATNSIGNTGSGASASGRTYTGYNALGVFVLGTWSGTGHWEITRLSGDANIFPENSADPATRFYRDFSGVPNGTTSGTASAWFRLWVYDDITGASAYADFLVSLAWQNTIPPYGPFVFTSFGYFGSSSSAGGAGHSITVPWSGEATVDFASGGPTSGNYSYLWTRTGGDAGVSCSNPNIKTPTFSGSFTVPPASTGSQSSTWQCLVTDTVSGYSYTVTGITIGYDFANNTG